MGTRADFYVGRGKAARWVGSIAWDGYPEGIVPLSEETEDRPFLGVTHKCSEWSKGRHLFDAKTEAEFMDRVERFFQFRDDVSRPEDGWPWPWDNSNTTDFSYAFDPKDGKVYGTCFGRGWWVARKGLPKREANKIPDADWPDMADKKRVRLGGPKSGLVVVSG